MKALLIRVGIDSAYGGLSPVWSDYSFKYIPINYRDLKEKERKEKRTYKSLGLEDYVSKKIVKRKVHYDPEFDTFTYGDPGKVKRKSLLELNRGDLLVFYMGGSWQSNPKEIGCYIFAYFVVDYVVDWNNLSVADKKKFESKLKNNAHLRSSKSKDNLVIVKGFKKSRLLKHCIPITKPNLKSGNPAYVTSEEIGRFLGIRDHITRSVPVWIRDEKSISNLRLLLGMDKIDPEKIEGKMPLNLLRRIIYKDRKLTDDEKLFFMNFMISKSSDYRTSAENFGTDIYIAGFKNVDLLDEYFINYFYKV